MKNHLCVGKSCKNCNFHMYLVSSENLYLALKCFGEAVIFSFVISFMSFLSLRHIPEYTTNIMLNN